MTFDLVVDGWVLEDNVASRHRRRPVQFASSPDLKFGMYKEEIYVCYDEQNSVQLLFDQNEDAPYYARLINGKGALALGQFSTRTILSHTMTIGSIVERV